jgi:hypothetical protein
MQFKIYRETKDVKWSATLADFDAYARRPSANLRWGLIGKHGFGKSSVLEFISWNSRLKTLPGDMLVTFLHALSRHVPLGERLDKQPFPTNEVHDTSVIRQWAEVIKRSGYNWDVSEGTYPWNESLALVLPSYDFYCTNLKRRTRQMLKDPHWKGYSADHWPILTKTQFMEYVDDHLGGKLFAVVPNYPGSDEPFSVFVGMLEHLAEVKGYHFKDVTNTIREGGYHAQEETR